MDGQIQETSSKVKFILPTVIIALIVFAAIGFYLYKSGNMGEEVEESGIEEVSEQTQVLSPSVFTATSGTYKNGNYSVTGNYVSPGGPRELNVAVTLDGNIIKEAEVTGTATDATSKRFQGEFIQNFKPMIIGKNIDEVNLSKVAGSSLSPIGFNDALAKIKKEASS